MLTDHDLAVLGAVCGVAALAGAFCAGWMLFADQDALAARLKRLEEREADRQAEERAARRVPAWDDDAAG